MTSPLRTDLDAIQRSILTAFPPLSRAAQQAGLALYRLLVDAGPVHPQRLAAAVGTRAAEILVLLNQPVMRCQLMYDDSDNVIGFAGLTIAPTMHQLTVGVRQMFTWCAWDALFIPQLLGVRSAQVKSPCPASGEVVRLTVTPQGVLPLAGAQPVLSFTLPDVHECVRSTESSIECFCRHVRLFASYEAGSSWVAARGDVFLLSLADAFELGRRRNAARFGLSPASGASASEAVPGARR